MKLFLGFLIGLLYCCVAFYFATAIDRKAYDKGITFTRNEAYKYALLIFLWPVTMWIRKIWKRFE